jgi:hypothetical protein
MAASRKVDHYATLGLPQTATPDEIRNAFRQLAKKYHPDLYHENIKRLWACRKMQEINTAYEVLSNPVKREAYDKTTSHNISSTIRTPTNATRESSTPSSNKAAQDKTWLDRFIGPFITLAWTIGTLVYFSIYWSQPSPNHLFTVIASVIGQLILAGIAVGLYAFMGVFVIFYVGAYIWALCIEPFQKAWKRHEARPPNFIKEFAQIFALLIITVLLAVPYVFAINGTWIPVLSLVSGILMWVWVVLIIFCVVELFALTVYALWARKVLMRTNALLIIEHS